AQSAFGLVPFPGLLRAGRSATLVARRPFRRQPLRPVAGNLDGLAFGRLTRLLVPAVQRLGTRHGVRLVRPDGPVPPTDSERAAGVSSVFFISHVRRPAPLRWDHADPL